jgi:hypothetical protein
MTKHKPLQWRESTPPAECPYDPTVQCSKDNEFYEPPYRLAGLAAAVFMRLQNGYWSTGDATWPADSQDTPQLGSTTWPDLDTRGAK